MADFKTQAAEYKKYIQGYEAREDRSRPPLPLKVLVEVSSFCNLACVYCATPLNPLSKNMDVETYRRIVTTFRDMDHAARFVLNANGEPFMNPRLAEMLQIDVGPDIVLQVISNGTLLRDRVIPEILDSNLNFIQFSIDSFHKDVFNAMRPGKNDRRDYYSQAFANILSFIIENERAGHPIYTSVSVMDEPARPERAAEQIDFWHPLLDNVFQDSLNNFGGNISSNETPTDRPQCCHVYEYMYITADGKVRGCCLDAKGLYIVGDFNAQSVPEIWHGEPMRRIRVANDRPAEIDSFDLKGLDCKGCDAPINGNGLGDSLVSIDRIAERFHTWKSMRDTRDPPSSDRISLAESYLEQLRSRGEICTVML